MILAKNDSLDYASEVTMRRLRYMISAALIGSDEREKLETESYFYDEEQALTIIAYLEQFQPIPSHDNPAHGVDDINRAVRYAVDKDTFYDRTERTIRRDSKQG